jgi:hypothetical protein
VPDCGEPHHLSAQSAEFAVTYHQHFVAGIDIHLFDNLEGGGKRLRKNRFFVGNVIRHEMKVGERDRNEFRKRAVGARNSHNRAGSAVAA